MTTTAVDATAVPVVSPTGAPPASGLFANRRVTAVLLVLGPIAEIVEALISPLGDGTTAGEMTRIAAHQQAFVVSVLFGLVGTLLYLPGFLGLMEVCRGRSPRWARVSAWLVVLSISSFVGLRATQGIELSLARSGLPITQAAAILDGGIGTPIDGIIFVLFLGGAFLGLIAMCIATWRAGFPRPAALLVALFQPVDLLVSGSWGTVASHLVLLVGLGWIALSLWRGTAART